LRVRGARDPSC